MSKKTPKQTETAPQAYAKHYAEIDALLEIVRERVDGVAPDCRKAHWGHVGTLGSIRQDLARIAAGLDIAEDGSEDAAHARLELRLAEVVEARS